MRIVLAGLGASLILLAPLPAFAQASTETDNVEGFDHLKPGEARPEIGESVKRSRFDNAVEKMFGTADTNRDGMVTLDELRAVIAGRKEVAITDRFGSIDTNRDRSLSYEEFATWQRSLGSLVLGSGATAAGTGIVPEDIPPEISGGAGSQVLAQLITPLGTTVIASANTDHDAGASLAEVLAYEGRRFDAVDTNHDSWVTEGELRESQTRR
ncbi:MAG: EF-hand domain-containing protein [Croceibacterium sp.]